MPTTSHASDASDTHWRDRLSYLTSGDVDLPLLVQKLSLGGLEHWEPGHVRKVWALEPDFLNAEGFLFGGYYGVLADQVATFAAMTVLGDEEVMRTASLHVDYYRPTAKGPLTLTGNVTNKSSSLLHVEIDFMRPDGKLAARAQAVFALRAAT
ncbi:hypothetical protein NBRC116588_22050 [Pyruvatibacter sp. HU-CL02332]|uniref:PaaI family thioesterase n=1 Tax=Pyruvatibacter sp. HU-CL02332 TaxID=3127650 RepID=UPI003105AF8B